MILIALGANLPGRAASALDMCRNAATALPGVLGLRPVGLSFWYRSAPVPDDGQPSFVNGVAGLAGAADPARILETLQGMERAAGRQSGARNTPRPLDLDIIDVGGLVRSAPDPVLPHPRAHLRAFVLRPLADVAPGWVHPVLHRRVTALLAALPPQRIERL